MNRKKKRAFSEEFRKDAVILIENEGDRLKEASERLGVHPSVLGKWKRQYKKEETSIFDSTETSLKEQVEENRRLGTENRRLQRERYLLKKAPAFLPRRPP